MATVIAVSISTPRVVDIGGRPTTTSIVRDPYPGALRFERGGPVGNRTAVHTEDALVTISESYDFWTRELGVAREAWPDCFWGENLTIRGLSEHTLRIGDRLAIGASALFEVTSPRIPCMKLSWRLGQPESFLRRLIDSGLTGFYLRVVTPGEVSAGDSVALESPSHDSITVAGLSQLLQDDSSDLERLKRTLATPALGRQASAMLRHRITHLIDGARCRQGRWQGWRPFVVSAIAEEAAEVRSFTLRPKDGEALAQYRAGQFLAVRLQTSAGRMITRTWSLSDYDEKGTAYRLTIRRAPNGQGSSHLHDLAKVGDTLDVRSPAGAFALDRSTVFRVVLISAGIGVTPLFSMLKAHAAREDAPPLLWIHTTRHGATHTLRTEADKIVRGNPQFRSHVVYTAPRPDDRAGIDYDSAGRLTPEQISRLLGANYSCRPFGREIELPSQAGLFYICGPEEFERSVRGALVKLGVGPSAIHSEGFGRALIDQASAVSSSEVRFRRSGITATWQSDADMSLLELAEQRGLTPPSSCRAGTCLTCETALVAGRVIYNPQPMSELAADRVLICCARPASATLELDL
ncbi:MAG: MOSC domain-containing protein [Steroidobacteraceae bacterium]